MSNRLFQGVIHQMRDTIDRTIGVIDETSVVIACSELGKIGEVNEHITSEMLTSTSPFVLNGFTYRSFGNKPRGEYAVFVAGNDYAAQKYAAILAISLGSIKQYYDEKVCFLIKISSKTDISAYDVIQNLFPDKAKDFVININETDIALVKEIKIDIDSKDLEKLASSIVDTMSGEFYTHCVIGIGTPVTGIKDLARSFKEAQVALEVGKVFDTERTIISYDNLGIARLVYQLPTTLCDMFLKEVFKKGSIESLDQETLFTIQRFFENNLNVSETSRKLFVHRNTLVYRLEKIKKLTGLDLREFEDAIVFKVALMVKKYLSSNPIKY